MDDIGVLIFIAFMVWSIIGGALGKRKRTQSPTPPSRHPDRGRRAAGSNLPPRMPEEAAREEAYSPAPVATRGDTGRERSAEDLVPQDLWDILTGERRSRVPEPVRAPDWSRDLEGAPHTLEPEPASWKPVPVLEAPVAVSLETPPLPPERRHEIFHERLKARPPIRSVARSHHLVGGLASPRALRRAVVLREILGSPKALE